MPKTQAFDRQAEAYDHWFEANAEAYAAELAAVRTLIPEGLRLVEVGVGGGRFAAPLGVELGIEPSPAMARIARGRGVAVVQAVAEALPLVSASLPGLLYVTVLCFVDDLTRCLAEAFRVLAPGGLVLIGFIDRASALGRAYEARKAGSRFYAEAVFRTANELSLALKAQGFEGLHFSQTLSSPSEGEGSDLSVHSGHGLGAFVVVRARKPLGEPQ